MTRTSRAVTRRRTISAAGSALAGFAVTAALFALWHGRLPDDVATHVGDGGHADGYTSRGDFLPIAAALQLGLGALFTGLTWLNRANPTGARLIAASGTGLAACLTYVDAMLLYVNRGVADAHAVDVSPWHIAAAVTFLPAGFALGWELAGPPPEDLPGAGEVPPAEAGYLRARKSEVLVWTRRVTSPVLAATGGVLLAVGVVVALLVGAAEGLALLLTGPLLLLFAAVRVTVDAEGVQVRYGALPRPRTRVPLARIERAGTCDVRAFKEFGGWGYRVKAKATGVVLRSGEALELSLAGGTRFVVTVPDARTAASVVNTLAARSRSAAAGPSRPAGGTGAV
ncbi:DUF1648 domain-containing protein [Yinghuangia seranimata]|uniref:DUF1648 domain-containing protein n=1 Tax=Yinghuangia seranimata TaxID=408067 RepID=UPI00248CF923|nr:DUF1648 domain-containing protein [Yinghuangia seranimata]MDI2127683.1 DUF1648 domain-containing protein [Yinghuangia seranimata]